MCSVLCVIVKLVENTVIFVNVHFSNPQQNGVCWKRRWGYEYWGKNEQIDLDLDLNHDIPIY